MKKVTLGWALLVGWSVAAGTTEAAELQLDTRNAWEQYVQKAQTRMQARLGPGQIFLWADEDPHRAQRLQAGQIEVAPSNGGGTQSVPHGLIHDWIGAIFLPNTTLPQALSVTRDYSRYKDFYRPTVADSQPLEPGDGADQFSLRWVTKVLFVQAALDLQCRSHYVRVDERRLYSTSYTTQVQEIQNYGQSRERRLEPDQGDGFIWRLYSITHYEERDGGVYLEMEAIALTRDIPPSLRWMVAPVVRKLSRNSLIVSLGQTRNAVRSGTDVSPRVANNTPGSANLPLGRALSPARPHCEACLSKAEE